MQPERLEEILSSILDRRQDRTDRREQLAELNQRATETDLRLKRLYDAIESGIADLADPAKSRTRKSASWGEREIYSES